MRESFIDIYDLFSYYKYIKLHVDSMKTIMPPPPDDIRVGLNAFAVRSQREEYLAFIGDVEKFVSYFHHLQKGHVLVPQDCLLMIFQHRFCGEPISPFESFGHLARRFRIMMRYDRSIPRRLRYKQHLSDIALEMEKNAQRYFFNKGYIKELDKTEQNL